MTNKKSNKKIKNHSKLMSVSEAGRIGGIANVKKHSKNHMSEIGRRGAKARWGNKK